MSACPGHSIKKQCCVKIAGVPSPWPNLSLEEKQAQLSGNGIGCEQLLSLKGLWHYSQSAILWHLLLKLWFKEVTGEISVIFRLKLHNGLWLQEKSFTQS